MAFLSGSGLGTTGIGVTLAGTAVAPGGMATMDTDFMDGARTMTVFAREDSPMKDSSAAAGSTAVADSVAEVGSTADIAKR